MSLTPCWPHLYEFDALLACWPTCVALPISLRLVRGYDTRQVGRFHLAAGILFVCTRVQYQVGWTGTVYDESTFAVSTFPRFSPPALSLAVRVETVAVTKFLSTQLLSLRVRDWDIFEFYDSSLHPPGGWEVEEVEFLVRRSSLWLPTKSWMSQQYFLSPSGGRRNTCFWRQASSTALLRSPALLAVSVT